jgi:hypothetical protein
MQHAGWKTPEKAISVELLQDFTAKSLFNTLFMMFNSRYRGKNLQQGLTPTTRQRIGRMYYILNAGERINHFAMRRCVGSRGKQEYITQYGKENGQKGSWWLDSQLFPDVFLIAGFRI